MDLRTLLPGPEIEIRKSKSENLLSGLSVFFLALVPVVFALKFFDTACGVNVLHLAREEGMASGANLDGDILAGAARDELVAAATCHGCFNVFRMYARFHVKPLFALQVPEQELLILRERKDEGQGE
jgi:hypothetical protein